MTLTNENINIIEDELTKKGTIRKRKPKTSNMYFTKETENAILEYLTLTDQNQKDRLYKNKIEYAFFKLTQNIIHTFKMYYLDGESIEDVQQEVICFLLEKLHLYKPEKGAAYSYFGTITKRYLIIRNQKNYLKLQDKGTLEDIDSDDNVYNGLVKEVDYEYNADNLFNQFVKYLEDNLKNILPDEEELKIGNALLILFKTCRDLEVFNKKALFIYVKEITDATTIEITKVIKKFKKIYINMFRQYYDTGHIDYKKIK